MREIKFRGKDFNGNWVCGDLIQYKSGEVAILNAFSKYGVEATEIIFRTKVDPNTTGQFTCLKDKNGVEIYEGDILKGFLGNCGGGKRYKQVPVITVMEFKEGGFTNTFIKVFNEFEEQYKKGDYRWLEYIVDPLPIGSYKYSQETKDWTIKGDGMTCYNVEVIGNIHDNKGLEK